MQNKLEGDQLNQQLGVDSRIIAILDSPNAQVERDTGRYHINSECNFAGL